MPTRKNLTGKRSGGSCEDVIPHSYGSCFAAVGFLGANSRDAKRLIPAKMMPRMSIARIGKY